MNIAHNLLAAAVALTLVGCAAQPSMPQGAAETRLKLTQLQADAQLNTRSPVALKEAEGAVLAAEQLRKDEEQEQALGQHLVVMADRKVEIAKALAQTRLYEDQRKALSTQREVPTFWEIVALAVGVRLLLSACEVPSISLVPEITVATTSTDPRGLPVYGADGLKADGPTVCEASCDLSDL